MNQRLAIDFGTSNTVLAVWDQDLNEGRPLDLPGYTRYYQQDGAAVPVIPSLIHYAADGRRWLGAQVLTHNLSGDNRTFRWMKRYIGNRSGFSLDLGAGRSMTPSRAGQDFLTSVLLFARQTLDLDDAEVALTAPVEAFEHYENWLVEVAEAVQLPHFRMIDEPSAAVLGYGAHIQAGDVYLLFDFGGGTLDVSMILIETQPNLTLRGRGVLDRRCRVLGKAGSDIGGMTVDSWIFQEFLRRFGLNDADENLRPVSNQLLTACEQAKLSLSSQSQASISLQLPGEQAPLTSVLTQADFEALLDEHEAFLKIERTTRRAINAARERGYGEENIKSVLMVGGSSQIPAVQRALQRSFGRERVLLSRPLDAIARGAAAFIAGVDFYDHIQHDYAIRYLDRSSGTYAYRTIVARGTHYPTPPAAARLTVKAAQDGQTHLGLAIFEISEPLPDKHAGELELVFDPGGAARLSPVSPQAEQERSHYWMNEDNPTFLEVTPPARQGEACFEVEFMVDSNKRLLLTARDVRNGQITHQSLPVVKLI